MSADNLALWDRYSHTDPAFTQKVSRGAYSFTAIDAYYKIRLATQEWGPMGYRWGYSVEHKLEGGTGHEGIVVCILNLFYPMSSGSGAVFVTTALPLWNETKNGWKRDTEAWKKSTTDALTKALSLLGFCNDVFLGKFDDNRYVAERRREEAEAKAEEKKGGREGGKAKPSQPDSLPEFDTLEDFTAALEKVDDEGVRKAVVRLWTRIDPKNSTMYFEGYSRNAVIQSGWNAYLQLREPGA